MRNTTEIGRYGESVACFYLQNNKFKIVEQNFYASHNEIDIIAENKKYIVFVEVKTRSSVAYGDVRETVTPQKMRNVVLAAEAYVKKNMIDLDVRFDVVTILTRGDTYEIEHVRSAFYPDIE